MYESTIVLARLRKSRLHVMGRLPAIKVQNLLLGLVKQAILLISIISQTGHREAFVAPGINRLLFFFWSF